MFISQFRQMYPSYVNIRRSWVNEIQKSFVLPLQLFCRSAIIPPPKYLNNYFPIKQTKPRTMCKVTSPGVGAGAGAGIIPLMKDIQVQLVCGGWDSQTRLLRENKVQLHAEVSENHSCSIIKYSATSHRIIQAEQMGQSWYLVWKSEQHKQCQREFWALGMKLT